MKCSRCGRELSEEQVYAYQGKPYCDDCLMETGLHAGRCEPWASYLATKELGGKGAEALTGLQKQIYEYIKNKGKATRAEVSKNLKLSEAEIDVQLTPLMFSELVKERSEKGQTHLITVR
jgi:hypothetical protein